MWEGVRGFKVTKFFLAVLETNDKTHHFFFVKTSDAQRSLN